MGRPTKLDADRVKRITELIRAGNYGEVAAKACGISSSTYYSWLAQGKAAKEKKGRLTKHEQLLVEFLDSSTRARAEAECRAVAIITKSAMDGDARSAMWYLERTAAERFGRTQRIEAHLEHEDKTKAPAEMTDEELLAYLSEHGLVEQ